MFEHVDERAEGRGVYIVTLCKTSSDSLIIDELNVSLKSTAKPDATNMSFIFYYVILSETVVSAGAPNDHPFI